MVVCIGGMIENSIIKFNVMMFMLISVSWLCGLCYLLMIWLMIGFCIKFIIWIFSMIVFIVVRLMLRFIDVKWGRWI